LTMKDTRRYSISPTSHIRGALCLMT
jgi:hypothetical protein